MSTCFLISFLCTVLVAQGFCNDGSSNAHGNCISASSSQIIPNAIDGKSDCKIQPLLEIKGAYFIFSNEKMRKIYNKGGIDVQLCGSFSARKWLQVYGSVAYMKAHGKSLHGEQSTALWEIPLSLGLKPVIKINQKIHYYFTLGPRYVFLHQKNNSSFVDRNVSQNGLGGFINTGFNFFKTHLLADIFCEYSFVRLHAHSSKPNVYTRRIQVGGFSFGLGLGYGF